RYKGKGAITSTTYLRRIVQGCFDRAILRLQEDGFMEDADTLLEATAHWLRHTGISDDVKRRPREHVRDDAGHSSGAITDKYIDVELRARHSTAKNKPLK
ncbi:MAG: site-specific integrase, partial [Gammaproteobacteria bacterium]|nr:site-specific integrase [Gammaproteobacteria bacterium]